MTHKTKVQPVILFGGAGTRRRPLSRAGFSKQFLYLADAESLFQQAAKRLIRLSAESDQMVDPLKRLLFTESQSNYILLGKVCRQANLCIIPLEIVEVQSSSYPGQGEFVRFEGHYGRTQS